MPVLSITVIAIGFLTVGLTAAVTIALLPLDILQRLDWFKGNPEISLWLLLVTCLLTGLVLFVVASEDRFTKKHSTTGGSALLAVGVLLGVEILLIQARPPGAPGVISLWLLFAACTLLGVIGVDAGERAKRKEREAKKETAQQVERQAEAACAEERMRVSRRLPRRHGRASTVLVHRCH